MNITSEDVLSYHMGGKIGLRITKPLNTVKELCLAYTPGVGIPVKEIHNNNNNMYSYTAKSNLVAVVTDGTAILGLGDLGAEASIPVMEGKAVLFKVFGDIDGWPVPLNCCRMNGKNNGPTDPQRIIDNVCAIAPMYGGINLEDIAAPACFEIEDTLDELLDIPVFHDDQWGTAVITLAGVINYSLLRDKKISDLSIVINGAGAAGIRIAEMLKAAKAENIILCDSKGVIKTDRTDLTEKKQQYAVKTSLNTVGDALNGADVFIGVSIADCITPQNILSMTSFPAIFAMANPDPEIRPEKVCEIMGNKPYVLATGRSDYPNQINNVLGFPFLFRGAIDVKAPTINMEMKIAAANALAVTARKPVTNQVQDIYPSGKMEFGSSYILPKPFDHRLFIEVSYAVAEAAVKSGISNYDISNYKQELEKRNTKRFE